jgi:signal transduction histidine kinase
MRKIYWLIAGSTLAMLMLIGFQIYWINTSRALIEEQFTNKVTMALCNTVDEVSKSPNCCQAPVTGMTSSSQCADQMHQMIQDSSFNDVLHANLSYFQINLPYQVNITSTDSAKQTTPPYSCSLSPIIAQNDKWLQLIFKGKKDYFHQKIRWTLLSSVLIVVLILSLFIYAARALMLQQRISDENHHYFNHMTHEFSTPLTNIQLAAKLMRKNYTDEKRDAYLDVVDQQCLQLKQQVDNVLHMASLDQPHFVLNKEPLHLPSFAREVVDGMKMQILEKNAHVLIHDAGKDCMIYGDRQHLIHVFRNLIDNALKYGSDSIKVNIDFENRQDGWNVIVRDNGIGIALGDQDKIFNRYYRGYGCSDGMNQDILYKPNKNGFGLGLAYVKKILNLHEGDIRLLPSTQRGAQFELYFPK